MNTIQEYILNQVSEHKLPIGQAKKMLVELEDKNDDIAIIGMACKFSKTKDIEGYWKNLTSMEECRTEFPRERLEFIRNISTNENFTQFLGTHPVTEEELQDTRKRGYLSEVGKFDAEFFGISPNEAKAIDPDQRLMLEVVQDALTDAGCTRKALSNSKTGVYIGKDGTNDTLYRYITEAESSSMTGNWASLIAGRINYLMNLKGSSMLLDSACSSGLVGVHLACKSLQKNENELAIVGGVSLNSFPYFNKFPHSLMESEDDTIRPFDEKANGTSFCEGAATVILKPLKKALKDKNNIYAVIKGSAFNNDGNTNGITAPNALAQEEVILDAWKDAGIDPRTIQYVETHGTGTKLGDPIEVKGLTNAFRKYTQNNQFCGIGSVKGNLGHTVAASGLASLIKVVLSLKNERIPATKNFNAPNPFVNFLKSPVYVVNKSKSWKRKEGMLRRAGVSSFGFTGTNCHVVLEEAPKIEKQNMDSPSGYLIALSALNEKSLLNIVRDYLSCIRVHPDYQLKDISYTSTVGRDHYNYRLAILATSIDDLTVKLENILSDYPNIRQTSVYSGYHKLVPSGREAITTGEVSQQMQNELTLKAAQIINEHPSGKDFSKEEMEKYSQFYVLGAVVNWLEFQKMNDGKIVSFPSYAYSKKMYWAVPKIGISSNLIQKQLHPLVHMVKADSIDRIIFESKFMSDSSWILTDHKMEGMSIIPGTAYVEMAREAASHFLNEEQVSLTDVIFYMPVVLEEGNEVTLQIVINKKEQSFVICSEKSGSWLTHVGGKFEKNTQTIPENYDVRSFYTDPEVKITKNSYVSDSRENGIFKFGPRWLNFQDSAIKETGNVISEIVSEIKLNDRFVKDLDEHYLHAAMLDNAVNLFIDEVPNEVLLPFCYGNINVFGKMPRHFYSHVVKKASERETKKFDIQLLDLEGKVFLTVQDYIVKRVNDPLAVVGAELKYYQIAWQKVEKPLEIQIPKAKEVRVVISNPSSNKFAQSFFAEDSKRTIYLNLSNKSRKISEREFEVGEDLQDYQNILQQISSETITEIVDMTSLYQGEIGSLRQGRNSLFHLFRLFKALDSSEIKTKFRFNLLVKNAHLITQKEQLSPNAAALVGFTKVVNEEYPNMEVQMIDIDDATSKARILRQLSVDEVDYLIAYREDKTYLPVMNEKTFQTKGESGLTIQSQGTYLITGGLGGLGLEMAKFIAAKGQAKIILANRSAFPQKKDWENIEDEQIRKKVEILKQVEEMGSSIVIKQLDITNEAEVSQFAKSIGSLNGIFHCAGVAGDGFIYNKTEEEFAAVIGPKTFGLELLNKYFVNQRIDFLILFSSIVSLLGGAGQSDYASANAYMDAYADKLRSEGIACFSINWPAWSETGMARRYDIDDEHTLFKSVTSEEAKHFLEAIVEENISQIIPGNLNYALLHQVSNDLNFRFSETITKKLANLNEESSQPSKKVANEISIIGKTGEVSKVEKIVAQAYANVLDLEEVDLYSSFSSLGGDSITATKLLKELNLEFPNVVEISDIFSYATVIELSKYIEEELGEQRPEVLLPETGEDDLLEMMNNLATGEADFEETLEQLNRL